MTAGIASGNARRTGLVPVLAGLGAIGMLIVAGSVLVRPNSFESVRGTSEQGAATHVHSAPGTGAVARPGTTVRVVSCEKLPNVPGKSVTTALVDFPPGALSPPHRHPGSVTAFVTKGTIRSQLAGGPVQIFGPGGTWFEPPGTLHMLTENPSVTDPAQLLAIFVANDDCGPLVVYER
jgi:quercetin dioxygenase-like cupin family protein